MGAPTASGGSLSLALRGSVDHGSVSPFDPTGIRGRQAACPRPRGSPDQRCRIRSRAGRPGRAARCHSRRRHRRHRRRPPRRRRSAPATPAASPDPKSRAPPDTRRQPTFGPGFAQSAKRARRLSAADCIATERSPYSWTPTNRTERAPGALSPKLTMPATARGPPASLSGRGRPCPPPPPAPAALQVEGHQPQAPRPTRSVGAATSADR